MGHVHVAAERAAHALRDDRLPVARGPIQKDALTRVHGRPDLLQHLVGHDEMLKAGTKPVAVDISARAGNRLHLADVTLEWNRGRTDILVRVEVLPRPVASQVAQAIAVPRVSNHQALDLDHVLARIIDERRGSRKNGAVGDGDSCRLTGIEVLTNSCDS